MADRGQRGWGRGGRGEGVEAVGTKGAIRPWGGGREGGRREEGGEREGGRKEGGGGEGGREGGRREEGGGGEGGRRERGRGGRTGISAVTSRRLPTAHALTEHNHLRTTETRRHNLPPSDSSQ